MRYSRKDYPMSKYNRDKIFTPQGKSIHDVTFINIEEGRILPDDCRTSKSSLYAQADIAESIGNTHIAENFRRAAELTEIDSNRVIEIYNALRPYRSTKEELEKIAVELEETYNASRTAAFIKEALNALMKNSKLRGDR